MYEFIRRDYHVMCIQVVVVVKNKKKWCGNTTFLCQRREVYFVLLKENERKLNSQPAKLALKSYLL